jgi:hypothetical protein
MSTVPVYPSRCPTCRAVIDPAVGTCAHHGTAPQARQQVRPDPEQQPRPRALQSWAPHPATPPAQAAQAYSHAMLAAQRAASTTPVHVQVTSRKSPGVAALLSLVWLGAGHLYADRIGVGVVLVILDVFLWLLSLTLLGAFVAVPIWLVAAPLAMISSASAARGFNDRQLHDVHRRGRLG